MNNVTFIFATQAEAQEFVSARNKRPGSFWKVRDLVTHPLDHNPEASGFAGEWDEEAERLYTPRPDVAASEAAWRFATGLGTRPSTPAAA